jgi:dienelactone hydrolase
VKASTARAGLVAVAAAAAIGGCSVAGSRGDQSAAARGASETIRVDLSAGVGDVDVYWPAAVSRAPLVIVAHGFSRTRHNMSGWGTRLAAEGFVVAVPDLPAWSDHARNGRFLSELRAFLCACAPWSSRIDPSRVGLVGFSAGGLASLLSAADSPGLAIWIGLDPVDRDGAGAKAAPRITCRSLVLTAEPSACNGHGNALSIVAALPHGEHFHVAGAVHGDAEWPTRWAVNLVCGRSTAEKSVEFRDRTVAALREALLEPTAAGPRG